MPEKSLYPPSVQVQMFNLFLGQSLWPTNDNFSVAISSLLSPIMIMMFKFGKLHLLTVDEKMILPEHLIEKRHDLTIWGIVKSEEFLLSCPEFVINPTRDRPCYYG